MTASAPHIVPDADLVGILRTYNEVTERLKRSHEVLLAEVQRLREEVCDKNRQLARRQRLAALGEMAAGVAHEIRNPLGGIGLYASLLERDLKDRPPQRDIALRISSGVQSLEAIVRDILAFAGGAEPVFDRVAARLPIQAAIAQAAARIEATGIQLAVDEALENTDLWCDPGQLERALANLIFNAIDAAGAGGRIWIRMESGDAFPMSTSLGEGQNEAVCRPRAQQHGRHAPTAKRQVCIAVEDDGPGIPAELAGRIFDPFFTTKHHGTGLGLAIVHSIVEAHGGQITAGQREGGGASFVLSLPGHLRVRSGRFREPSRCFVGLPN